MVASVVGRPRQLRGRGIGSASDLGRVRDSLEARLRDETTSRGSTDLDAIDREREGQFLAGRMQLAIWELVEEGCLRPEAVEVRLAEGLPLIAGATIVEIPRS